ncbi:DUF2599 domain-containing protein [Luteibacter yeojuensis]|uniref:DUF2599 domain-containing protein n=1 Tax=Luteibacter yeojuensis TaxID=345309 RepID=A0A7X5QXX5_9GAMM|nr:DUF2599 domain-containing protein [Luteibacter yeojuensis]NID17455.1 DUF2599 domain-containing protein [Luteibacter yeojuensis]
MKSSAFALAGIAVLCIVGGAGWMAYRLREPPPMAVSEPAHAPGAISAKPCNDVTGEKFIESGVWSLDEFGPRLSITPTRCGRDAGLLKRDSLVMEVIERFSGNINWRNTRGMINQLDCHLFNVPHSQREWDLEPDRPYVGYAQTRRDLCNPHVPRPDPPFE